MARSHVARYRGCRLATKVPARVGQRLARAAAGCVSALAILALPLLGGTARADVTSQIQPASGHVKLTVRTLSPSYATTGQTMTIAGTVRNLGGTAISGLTLRLFSSRSPLTSMSSLQQYANGSYWPKASPATSPVRIGRLAGHRLAAWTVHLKVDALGLDCFGIYPLTATVSDATGFQVGRDPVPLPFWPHDPHSCPLRPRPRPSPISWVWPLIDSPHQGACPGLLDNFLFSSLAPGGRLRQLLTTGARYTTTDRLTWAIDPALLGTVQAMTHPYQVGTSANCGDAKQYPASRPATAWLAALRKAIAGQDLLVTPYADVDIAALVRRGSADLKPAFKDGDQLAGNILQRSPVPAASAGGHKLAAIAWPADGVASPAVLQNLASLKIGTVVVAMPANQLPYTPGAVSSVNTGYGTTLHVLYADDDISQLLRSPAAASRQPGSIFGVSQLFLAETAMFIAEMPSSPRPLVIAPPRRWGPAQALANDLLANTASAPWLKPTTASRLASLPPGAPYTAVPRLHSKAELPARLLRQTAALDRNVELLRSIMVQNDPALRWAVFGVESSAWRGAGVRHARAMLARTSKYVASQFKDLKLGGVTHDTLGGTVSNGVPVSIRSSLDYPVRVRLRITAGNKSVSAVQPPIIVVKPHTVANVKLTVKATQTGSGKLVFSLQSPGRHPHTLPVPPRAMQIRATDFGTVALVIGAVALAVFVVASAGRAIRGGRPKNLDPNADPVSGAAPAPAGGPQEFSATVEPGSVMPDGSELTPAGPVPVDLQPSTPGHPEEES